MEGTYLALISGLTLDMRKGIIRGTICKQNKNMDEKTEKIKKSFILFEIVLQE
jgi:hypothetical protein